MTRRCGKYSNIYLHKGLISNRLPPTYDMIKRNGVWEPIKIQKPIVEIDKEAAILYERMLKQQMMDIASIFGIPPDAVLERYGLKKK